jgi:hypothetical protein
MISAAGGWKSVRPSTGACLDDLLAARVLPCFWAARDWAVCKLPDRLERCGRDLAPDLAWRPYANADRRLFVFARAHRLSAGHWRGRALNVYFLDGNAVVHCAGVWVFDESRGWWNLEPGDD